MIPDTRNCLHITCAIIPGLVLALFTQTVVAEGRGDIVVLRDVPPHVPYRPRPVGRPTLVDPSPDEQLLAALGLEIPDESGNSQNSALGDADIAAFSASAQPAGTGSQATGPGFMKYLYKQQQGGDGLHATQLTGLLSGGRSPGAAVSAATADISANINRALAPLNGLTSLR